jgi:sirohydrochlorin ferrochelatase
MRHAILIVGHGSRDPDGVAEFLHLAAAFAARRPGLPVAVSFLEFARPTIQEGVDQLVAAGADTVVVLPGVLTAAGHAKNDMASEVRTARRRYPHVALHMGGALELDPDLLRLCRQRYLEAIRDRAPADPAETLLLLVGRGSSDPDANANIAKVARFLQEGYPTAWAAVAYSGVARPSVEEALAVCARSGFRRIVVQPYFLFTGVLLQRIYGHVERRQRERPDVEFVPTPHLGVDPLLVDAFVRRADEALNGAGHMNCSLCQYRVPIIGREDQVAQRQEAHHHHVEGLLGPAPPLVVRTEPEGWETAADPHPWTGRLMVELQF